MVELEADDAAQLPDLCEKLLANPLIEDYEIVEVDLDETFGVLQFPGSCDERDALAACERVGDARLVWHEETRSLGHRRGRRPRRLLLRRLPACRGDRPVLARDGGGRRASRRTAARCWASATASRSSARRGCCPARCCRTRGSAFTSGRSSWKSRATCDWTAEIEVGERLSIPVKHMSGRYFAPDDELDRLEASGQVVLRYAAGQNPNGSAARRRRSRERGRQRDGPDAPPRARGRPADRFDRRPAPLRSRCRPRCIRRVALAATLVVCAATSAPSTTSIHPRPRGGQRRRASVRAQDQRLDQAVEGERRSLRPGGRPRSPRRPPRCSTRW